METLTKCSGCCRCFNQSHFLGHVKEVVNTCIQCRVKDAIRSQRPDIMENKVYRYNTHTYANLGVSRVSGLIQSKPFSLEDAFVTSTLLAECYYCGVSNMTSFGGLDRLDSTIGYCVSNVVPCCATCNMMKKSLDPMTFLDHVNLIASNASKLTCHINHENVITYDDAHSRYTIYQQGAAKRDLVFEVPYDSFAKLIQMSCFYCKSSSSRNGVDRYDNIVGYIVSNCVPCCTRCNFMKGSKHGDTFIDHCKTLLEYQTRQPSIFPNEIPLQVKVLNKRPLAMACSTTYKFDWREHRQTMALNEQEAKHARIREDAASKKVVPKYIPNVNGRYLDFQDVYIEPLSAYRRMKADYPPTLYDAKHFESLSELNWDMDGCVRLHLQKNVFESYPSLFDHGYTIGDRIELGLFIWLVLEGNEPPQEGYILAHLNGIHHDVRLVNLLIAKEFTQRLPDNIVPPKDINLPNGDMYFARGLKTCDNTVDFVHKAIASLYNMPLDKAMQLKKINTRDLVKNFKSAYENMIIVVGSEQFSRINNLYQKMTYEYHVCCDDDLDMTDYNTSRESCNQTMKMQLDNPSVESLTCTSPKIQKYSRDGSVLIKTYTSAIEARRDPENNISDSQLVVNIKNKSEYNNHRWAFLHRLLPDDTFQALGDTNTNISSRGNGYVAMLKDGKVVMVFSDKSTAAKHHSVSKASITHAEARGTMSCNHTWTMWNNLELKIREEYLARDTLPAKSTHGRSKPISRTHNGIVQRYASVSDAATHLAMSRSTINAALKNNVPDASGNVWSYT